MSGHFQSGHFASGHFRSGHFGRVAIIRPPFTPEPVFPPGTGEDAEARWRRIIIEDEMLLAVIMAWLQIKDR